MLEQYVNRISFIKPLKTMYETEKRVLPNEACRTRIRLMTPSQFVTTIYYTMEHFSLTHFFSYTGGIMARDHILLRETMQLLWWGPSSWWVCVHCTLIKRKLNFPHIQGNSNGIGCKVIYEEGLPNIWRNAQIFHRICMRRPLVIYDFAPDPSEFPYLWEKISFLFYHCTILDVLVQRVPGPKIRN